MSTTALFPERTEEELLEFFLQVLPTVPERSMTQIRNDTRVVAKQADTVEIPVTSSGPRHLRPYRGPKLWRHPWRWLEWNFGHLIYWGLYEQNGHGSHRVV